MKDKDSQLIWEAYDVQEEESSEVETDPRFAKLVDHYMQNGHGEVESKRMAAETIEQLSAKHREDSIKKARAEMYADLRRGEYSDDPRDDPGYYDRDESEWDAADYRSSNRRRRSRGGYDYGPDDTNTPGDFR